MSRSKKAPCVGSCKPPVDKGLAETKLPVVEPLPVDVLIVKAQGALIETLEARLKSVESDRAHAVEELARTKMAILALLGARETSSKNNDFFLGAGAAAILAGLGYFAFRKTPGDSGDEGDPKKGSAKKKAKKSDVKKILAEVLKTAQAVTPLFTAAMGVNEDAVKAMLSQFDAAK